MSKGSVLVIDDDPVIRLMLTHQLQQQSFEVTSCENADVAMEQANPSEFEAIVCDYQMPGMTGLELYHAWGSDSVSSFVLMTGHLEADELPETPEGVKVLNKPVSTSDLLQVLA